MSTPTRNRFRAAAMAVAPVALLAAFLYQPYLPGAAPGPETIAQAVEADPTRWAVAQLLTVGAFALFVLAFQALRGRLRDAGEERWSSFAFPLVVVGGVVVAAVIGMQVTFAGAARTGADTAAPARATDPFLSVVVIAAVAFLVGILTFARGIAHSRIMGRSMTTLVVIAAVVMGLALAAPIFHVIFYVAGIAAIVTFWPLAWATVRTGSATEGGVEPTAEADRDPQRRAVHPNATAHTSGHGRRAKSGVRSGRRPTPTM
ncbi:hypothetical protein [Nocardiopsis aegyptia]|uniref:Uncharacterized membrane protein YhaH (DUF805 family) n=1 Tax=Nocardiopsis aegyptia TaxID=220378 RepID=A0A7Z0J7X1_9ACTN|nr:hypothetical protein [Nocardiopsis aegyptia]NYJ32341.1 uncharacterized membrane protein YhaH (DUF805 family) [Nocardiopsis aegyptia]